MNNLMLLSVAALTLAAALPSAAAAVSTPAISITSGDDTTCTVISGGKVKCWGSSDAAGAGTAGTRVLAARLVPGLSHVKTVTTGANHACALITDGSVKCWGRNSFLQLGNSGISDPAGSVRPVEVTGVTGAVAIDAGSLHTCAVLGDGTVMCWGSNYLATSGQRYGSKTLAHAVPGVSGALTISAGGDAGRDDRGAGSSSFGDSTTCAATQAGKVSCWGRYSGGKQVSASPSTSDFQRWMASEVVGLTGVKSVSVGRQHACAIRAQSELTCWGMFYSGPGTSGSWRAPTRVMDGIKEVAAGMELTCAVRVSGTATCFGSNSFGQAGDGTSGGFRPPGTNVASISSVSTIAVGRWHACAIHGDHFVSCWGANNGRYGTLGNGIGFPTQIAGPVAVSGFKGAIQVGASEGHSCALMVDGTVMCWGGNGRGQLGDGTTDTRARAGRVNDLTDAIQISVGFDYSCALREGGTIKCWGYNTSGQLGNGTVTFSSLIPVQVSGISNAVAVSAGREAACALLADRSVRCWGRGDWGQLPAGSSPTPVAIPGLDASAISSGEVTNCAVAGPSANEGWCWGNNDWGQLGDGKPFTSRPTPDVVPGLSGLAISSGRGNGTSAVSGVSAGRSHVCATVTVAMLPSALGQTPPLGRVTCFGENSRGQLGTGSCCTPSLTPAATGIDNAVSVDAGSEITCAVVDDPAVKCWGRNNYGQLGDGTTSESPTPRSIPDVTGPIDVSIMERHACATESSGEVKCWGANFFGQLGRGTYVETGLPGRVLGLDSEGDPFTAPCTLPVATGVKTGARVRGGWRIRTGSMFWNCGDERGGAGILTVQFAVDANGRPLTTKPSDSDPIPTSPSYQKGIARWDAGADVVRDSSARPVWVRVGNRVGKWSAWAQIAY